MGESISGSDSRHDVLTICGLEVKKKYHSFAVSFIFNLPSFQFLSISYSEERTSKASFNEILIVRKYKGNDYVLQHLCLFNPVPNKRREEFLFPKVQTLST